MQNPGSDTRLEFTPYIRAHFAREFTIICEYTDPDIKTLSKVKIYFLYPGFRLSESPPICRNMVWDIETCFYTRGFPSSESFISKAD